MIIYIFSVILLLIFFHVYTRYSRFGRLINKIPGPRPLPFLGNLLQFNVSREKAWSRVCDYFDQYYPIYKLWSFTNAAVLIRHPDDFKIILSCKKNIDKCPAGYSTVKYTGTNGILFSDGNYWHPRRKILNPAFNTNLLEIYMQKISKRAAKFALDLRSQGDTITDNISTMFLKFALAVVCEAVMDFDVSSMSIEEEERIRNTIIDLSEITMYRVCRPYILDWMLPFLPIGKRLAKINKVLDDFRTKITNERRRYHERIGYSVFKSQVDELEDDVIDDNVIDDEIKGLKKHLAVVDLLLMAERKGLIDNHGVLEEALTIASAGFETTGMAICFLFVLLAENKNIQDLAREELIEVLGKNHDGITVNHVKKLDYLERCIKESLRLYPTAPHYGRIITEEIQLSKYRLPVGTEVYMSAYDLHRDSNFWPEPNKFDPDRFLPENVQNRHPFAYLPFSAGLRNCIGQKFAMMEMKIMAAHMLYNFYLEPIDSSANFKFALDITMKIDDIRLKFIRRDLQ